MLPCISGKLKPRHIPGTAGTHQRLKPGTLAPLRPAIPGPRGAGDANDRCIIIRTTTEVPDWNYQ